MTNASNRVLTLLAYRARRQLLNFSGIVDLGAFCVELWTKQVLYRISIPIWWLGLKVTLKGHFRGNLNVILKGDLEGLG